MSTPDTPSSFTLDWIEYDDPGDGQRWSTWGSVEPLCRGPEPRPEWVVTSAGAIDSELGILKTGKEADVHLIERADPVDPERGVVMAAKRYRSPEHATFQRSSAYTDGRRVRDSRVMRAMARKTEFGREVSAGQWAIAEWGSLNRLWQLGMSVPYPVQIDGTEILMEWISVDGDSAPRLAQMRPGRVTLDNYWSQVLDALRLLASEGLVHGDLSPYNILAAGERLVFIDLPQVVDLFANPHGHDLLHRDCRNVVSWFAARGLDLDADDVFATVAAAAF
ncbi:MAG TPA: RIO1 family regulatory kinase/ATPase [Marmoricola sp.]|nr:RIO1 family regulatory kinase/ATPase [Marmoricola sp.]